MEWERERSAEWETVYSFKKLQKLNHEKNRNHSCLCIAYAHCQMPNNFWSMGATMHVKWNHSSTHWLLKLFAKNTSLRHFGDFQPGNGQIRWSTQKGICNMTACLYFHYHHVLKHFFLGMGRNQNFVLSLFVLFFGAFPLSPLLISLLQWFTSYWTCLQFKNFWDSIMQTDKFYHGIDMRSCMQFCP